MDAVDRFQCSPLSMRLLSPAKSMSLSTGMSKHRVQLLLLAEIRLPKVGCWMITGERQATTIRSLYLKTILRQDIAYFDTETTTGEVIGRMSGDTVLIQEAMGEKVGKCIQLATTFFGGFTVAFVKGWLLAVVMLSSIPLLVIAGGTMSLFIAKMAARGQNAYADAASLVEQTVGAIRTVASFTGEKRAISIYNSYLVTAYKSGVNEGIFAGLGSGVVMLIIFSSFGARMIIDKGYTGGVVINVIIAILTGSMALGQTSPCMSAFAAGRAAAYKMFETINRKPAIDAYDTTGRTLDTVRGDIELKDIYFSYPARPDEHIFSGFSLTIPSGTTAALVGHTGEVLIDGINLKELQLKWIREKIGLVGQEPALFTSSIKDNIAYGKDGASFEEIRKAAELANATKFIDKLPQGFDTMVGEHGTQLSGGQKQRIAIARAILKDPRILLLDEATIIVAHRLTTVRNADMIAVIHRGKVVEKVNLLFQDLIFCGFFLPYHGLKSNVTCSILCTWSQLIRLQEMNKQSEQGEYGRSEITSESFRQSSLRSSWRSISRASSRGSSRQSFALTFGLPLGISSRDHVVDDPEEILPVENAPEVPLSRLAALNKPEIPALVLGTIAACVNGVIMPIYALLLSQAIKIFYESHHKLRKDSKFWSLMFLALGLASVLINPVRSYFFARIRAICFEKVVNMEIGWFDFPEHSTGAISARLSTDAAIIRSLVGDQLAATVQNIATVAAAMIIAFTASWQLALIILALIPVLGINGVIQTRSTKGFSADMMYEQASQVATDAVGSIRTVASFCSEEKVMQLYRSKCEGPIRAGKRLGAISGVGFGVSSFLLYAFQATCFYAGARLVKGGHITFADVFRVFFASTVSSLTVSHSSSFTSDTTKAKRAAASVFSIIDAESKIDPSDESGTTLANVKGEIQLRHVKFRYPTRPDMQIFKDINLTIHSGKTVALVGESGSGKSTVISLLLRFYDPEAGRITIDGTEIHQLQLKWLRQQMGLVSQEPALFNDTIRANIAYGKGGEATEAEIIAAAELANAHKFICSLQQGYDTMVGERGVQLSGGQKQRIAIARAIVKSPKILLLDEATSALDAESERVVQAALDKVMVNRTTVVVAHRLSTIRNADVIAVVKNGVIAEKGRHESLIKIKDGAYASLVALHSSGGQTA
ncbi:hypothetical protein Tsubulata_048249, partial [Turnera subulata]